MNHRWVKPAGPTYAPRCFVTVVVEGEAIPGTSGQHGHDERWARAAACVSRFRYGKWSDVEMVEPATGTELIEWVEGQARPEQGTWVVAPIASYALALSGFFGRWEELGVRWNKRGGFAPEGTTPAPPGRHSAAESPTRRPVKTFNSAAASDGYIVDTCITRGNPDVLRYTVGGKRLTWVSGQQYWGATEDGLASMLSAVGPQIGPTPPSRWASPRTPADRVWLWMLAMQRLADWWRRIDGGPWGATMGALSMNYYRRRLTPKTVLSHQHPDAREVEERALFGGRAGTWLYADIGKRPTRGRDGSRQPPAGLWPIAEGPLEHWDIASMYPTILAREVFPELILYRRHEPPVSRLVDELTDRCVIADVTLETDRADYPYRNGDAVEWPVGVFRTCLAGPELTSAIALGHVKHCWYSVSYRAGRPFSSAASTLLKLRREANKLEDPTWEQLVKYLSNAFSGKLAQRRHDWTATPGVSPLVSWGEWTSIPSDPALRRTYRAAAGLVWTQTPHKHHGRPLAACFCYLTSHGRALMRDLMRLIPPDRLVSMDTDGLWIRKPTGYLWAKVRRAAAERGYTLRRTAGADSGRWYGPRHYWTDHGWVLAGYHEPTRIGPGLTFLDRQTHIPRAELADGAPRTVQVRDRITQLSMLQADGRIGETGWITPTRMTGYPAPPQPSPPSTSQADLPPT